MRTPIKHPKRQRGAILVVSLLLLLVLSVLGITASQTTRMEERMAGNARDVELAFQAGEAGLRGAETRLQEDVAPKGAAPVECDDPDTCDADSRDNTEALDFVEQDPEWWEENAHALGKTLQDISLEPHYYTEVWADVPDTLTVGSSMPKSGTMYYTNTSRSQGATATAVTLTESNYAVRY
jgi:type IV pilus assembly protein PilX